MKSQDLRKKSVDELKKDLTDKREDLFNMRFKHATAQLEKTSALPEAKRDIARILTILKEKGA